MKLFRIVDSDDKSILSYVYEGMYRARKTIKEIISNKKRLFRPYIRIVKDRWDNQLRKNIYVIAYWFNPAFQYYQSNFPKKPEVMTGLLDVIDSKLGEISSSKFVDETKIFRDREKGFGRQLTLTSIKTTCPSMLLIKFKIIFNFKHLIFYSLIIVYFVILCG